MRHFITFGTEDKASTGLFPSSTYGTSRGRFGSGDLIEASCGWRRICEAGICHARRILIERGHRSVSSFQQSIMWGHTKRCTGADSVTMSETSEPLSLVGTWNRELIMMMLDCRVTVWKYQDFSVNDILCEINFRESRTLKTVVFFSFRGSEIGGFGKFQSAKSTKVHKNQNFEPLNM